MMNTATRAFRRHTGTRPRARQPLAWLLAWLFSIGAAHAAAPNPPAAAIASAHPLATEAGQAILAQGGNAFDAAIAVAAALAVVEPAGSGLGGGGFFLLHEAQSKRDVMVDARETAPAKAHRDMYLDAQGNPDGRSRDGALAAAIPGLPAGLVHLAKNYARLPLKTTLAPAIRHAREGFAIDERYQMLARWRASLMARSPDAARIFLRDGAAPALGTEITQAELAQTLEKLANEGAAGFYAGPVADALVAGVQSAGGIWSREDLAQYRVVERSPVTGRYHGMRIVSAPPPSSGGVALIQMFNILEGFEWPRLDAAGRIHVLTETMRRAYRDRADYLGDPDFVTVPVDMLTSPLYAAGLRASIRLDRATQSLSLPGFPVDVAQGTHTTHLSVLDKDGNRVAATLSINLPFGSGFMPAGTGVILNNEMDDFAAKAGVPNAYGLIGDDANAIAPGKRPLSSMTPTFLETDDRVGILGTPGGSRIITMVLLGALSFADGSAPEAWVSAPRFHHQFAPDVLQHEAQAFSQEVSAELVRRGHTLKAVDRAYGNMQAILWDKAQDKVQAASDPRGGGSAVVLP